MPTKARPSPQQPERFGDGTEDAAQEGQQQETALYPTWPIPIQQQSHGQLHGGEGHQIGAGEQAQGTG